MRKEVEKREKDEQSEVKVGKMEKGWEIGKKGVRERVKKVLQTWKNREQREKLGKRKKRKKVKKEKKGERKRKM